MSVTGTAVTVTHADGIFGALPFIAGTAANQSITYAGVFVVSAYLAALELDVVPVIVDRLDVMATITGQIDVVPSVSRPVDAVPRVTGRVDVMPNVVGRLDTEPLVTELI
jgi:hypothetical protein